MLSRHQTKYTTKPKTSGMSGSETMPSLSHWWPKVNCNKWSLTDTWCHHLTVEFLVSVVCDSNTKQLSCHPRAYGNRSHFPHTRCLVLTSVMVAGY